MSHKYSKKNVPCKIDHVKRRKMKRSFRSRRRRMFHGGSWLTTLEDWNLGNTIVNAGYNLPIGGTTSTSKNDQSYPPIDQYYALPCIDYTQ